MIRRFLVYATTAVLISALPASAACYAEYRAQQSNPVRFHVGVAQVSDGACGNIAAAANELSARLRQNGWTLVNVLSTFGPEGLGSRQGNAGQYYLRY
ncbi:MAG: hypothetical protein KDK01_04340 [Rhodobacteraceae bacterium]|nr:hypothetical protein [Paracoccaceae bacterium]